MMKNKMIKILAIPGSLREQSSSNIVMHAVSHFPNEGVDVQFYDGLSGLPHFDDSNETPQQVVDLRRKIAEVDGIFICTPEYAFGVPGSLKNALDWTVSSGEFVNKPVALVTASSSGEKGHAALLLILSALSANVQPKSTLLIPFVRAKVRNGKLIDHETLTQLKSVMTSLIEMIEATSDRHQN
jgi:NAD(P)H-dependent FMN reductase